jgi:hypothetical protein
LNTCGVVYVLPSTNTWRPEGTLVTVCPTSFPKFAVSTFGPSITIPGAGFAVDDEAPLHPVNWYPGFAVAVTPVVEAPAFHQLTPEGATEPPTAGFDDGVKLYCFPNVAVYVVDPWGIVNQWSAA